MPKARLIVRAKIPPSADAAELLRRRNEDPNPDKDVLVALALRNFAEIARPIELEGVDPKEEISEAVDALPVWGLLHADTTAEAVRARLIDKLSVMTEVVPEDDAAEAVQQDNGLKEKTAKEPTELIRRFQRRVDEYGKDPDNEDQSDEQDDGLDRFYDPNVFLTIPDFDGIPRAAVGVDQGARAASTPPQGADFHWNAARGGGSFGKMTDVFPRMNLPRELAHGFVPREKRGGDDVNVVIIDAGFNVDYLRSIHPGLNFGGGFVSRDTRRPLPGRFDDPFSAPFSWHGNMIAEMVLRIAPNVTLWDAPILPSRVIDVPAYSYDVELLYEAIGREYVEGMFEGKPLVLVNAWSVADTIQQYDFGVAEELLYSRGDLHRANRLVQLMSTCIDTVFAAGNFGEFAPAPGAGLYNRGPERSIHGSNALGGVFTTSACDMTGLWIGAASQGDGPEALKFGAPGDMKPDIMTPSWFSADHNAAQSMSGTSTSCGLLAGAVASLRTEFPDLTPEELKKVVQDAANEGTKVVKKSARSGAGRLQMF